MTPQKAILDGHIACEILECYKSVGMILVVLDDTSVACVKDNRITLLA